MPDLADPLLSPVTAVQPSAAVDMPPLDEDESDARVRRLRSRFQYAWNHPKWRRWREEAKEDWDFQTGRGQWDEAIRAKLQEERRPALTFNRIRRAVSIITGYERTARLDLKYVPASNQFVRDIETFNRLAKRAQNDQQAGYTLSDFFKDGVVGGLGVVYAGIDYDDDWIDGRPWLKKTRVGEVLWDPDADEYDLTDAREVFWQKMVPVDELVAHYPKMEDEIYAALDSLNPDTPLGDGHDLPARDPNDGYLNVRLDGLTYYDAARNEVLVVQAWYRVYDQGWLLVDERSNSIHEVEDDMLDLARQLVAADPEVTLVKRSKKRIDTSVFLPATNQELDHGNPFENDQEDYPFIPFIAYKEGDEMLGIIRNMKDPQRDYNKRRSAIIDAISKHGYYKWVAEVGSVENPEFFENTGASGGVLWKKQGRPDPKEVAPPELPLSAHEIDQKDKQDMDDIPGVNAALLGGYGQGQTGKSGAALKSQQAQGQIMVSELFDNYRRSRRLVGLRFGKRIQQVYTGEKITRLEGAGGRSEFVTLNEKMVDPETGHESVMNDIPSLKWDIEVTDSPSTPTAIAADLAMLFEFLKIEPQFAPGLADVMLGMMPSVPNREQLIERIRVIMRGLGIPIQPDGSMAPQEPGPGQGQQQGQKPAAQYGQQGRRPRPHNQMGPLVQAVRAQQGGPPMVA